MAREADRDLAAKLKAKLVSTALRGDATIAELATQFKRIDQWAAEPGRDTGDPSRQSETALGTGPAPPGAPPPAQSPAPPAAEQVGSKVPTLPTLPSVPRVPMRLKAPTLPTLPRLPTLPTILEQTTLPQARSRSEARSEPVEEPPLAQHRLAEAEPEQLPNALSDSLLDDDFDFWEEGQAPGAGAADLPFAGASPGRHGQPSPAWTRRLLGPLFVGWQERHHAAKTSRELLRLYGKVAAAHPGLTKAELYRRIVMARLDAPPAGADMVIARATESFATWPTERALTFRDVVHYLAVSDYLASNGELAEWTRENLGRVVAERVPDTL